VWVGRARRGARRGISTVRPEIISRPDQIVSCSGASPYRTAAITDRSIGARSPYLLIMIFSSPSQFAIDRSSPASAWTKFLGSVCGSANAPTTRRMLFARSANLRLSPPATHRLQLARGFEDASR
jgi:hypothetical protein